MSPKILLVDDKPENLFALKQTIERLDVRPVTALDGNEALRATLVHDFALAILDVQMPGMDGYELATLLRGDKKTKNIPIIFLTAVYSAPIHAQHGYLAGAVDFITKPFIPEALLAKVQIFLELYQQRRALQTLLQQQRAANAQLQAEIAQRIQLEKELQQAKDAAEAASQSKSMFLASMSHEIRNPLNGVLGMLQLIQATHLDKEQRHYVRSSTDAAKSLLRVINDVLDITRIEAGRFDIVAEDLSLWELTHSVLATFKSQADQKRVTLSAALDLPPQTRVRADAGCLRQILYNLVGNALKFTLQGGVNVNGRLASCDEANQLRLQMCVTDTGCGIPRRMQPLVFDMFTQAHTGAEHRGKGSGLGLGIVQRLVELMQGRVLLCSEEGVGTTVCFDVLVEPAAAEASPRPSHLLRKKGARRESVPPAGETSQLSVLLVEDEVVNRLAALAMLKKMGHHAMYAENGEKALELLETNAPDLILMDVSMPVLDGIETTRRIRNAEDLGAKPRIPIVAMTAHAMRGDRERMLAAGMDDYLAKPIDMEELRFLIQRIAESRRRQSARQDPLLF
jgi:CheY-like chemotaxis protein/anti-sigma regulatory factor (Ser/Thr protein kinase)